jgi:hypothetical protein
LPLTNLPDSLNTASAHDTDLRTALQALRRFGARVPDDHRVQIVAIEVLDVWTFSERCSPAVEQQFPAMASLVLQWLLE